MPRDRRAADPLSTQSPESTDYADPDQKWSALTDTGSMTPSPEAMAWQRRADAWAQQTEPERGQAVEPANRWSEVTSTGRATFPAHGAGWRTETAEWRAAGAAWRQTTEWRSTTGSHGWRSTTEAWQTDGNDKATPPAETPTAQPAISGTAWQESGDPLSDPVSPRSRHAEPAAGWQQLTTPPTASWQEPDPGRRHATPRPPADSSASWQQLVEPTPAQSWNAPAHNGTPSWQRDAIEGSATWTDQPGTHSRSDPAGSSWLRTEDTPETPSWQRSETPSWRTPRDDGRHLVREDDRAAWRRDADLGGTQQIGRRRAPEDGSRPSGGTGWVAREDADNWAGHTDTGSIQLFPDPATSDSSSWDARSYDPARRGPLPPARADGASGRRAALPAPPDDDAAHRSGRYDDTRLPRSDDYGTARPGRSDSRGGRTFGAPTHDEETLGGAPSGQPGEGRRRAPEPPPYRDETPRSRVHYSDTSPQGFSADPDGYPAEPRSGTAGGYPGEPRSAPAGGQRRRNPESDDNGHRADRPYPVDGLARSGRSSVDDSRRVDSGGPDEAPRQRRALPGGKPTDGAPGSRPRYHVGQSDWREQTSSWEAEPDTSSWTRDPDTGQWSRSGNDPRVEAWRREAARREAAGEAPPGPAPRGPRGAMPTGGMPDAEMSGREPRGPGNAPRSAMPGGSPSGRAPRDPSGSAAPRDAYGSAAVEPYRGGPAGESNGRASGGGSYGSASVREPDGGARYADPYDRDPYDRAPGRETHDRAVDRDPYDRAPGRDSYDRAPGRDPYDGAPGRETHDRAPGRDPYDRAPGRDSYDRGPGRDPYDRPIDRESYDRAPGRDPYDRAPGRDPYDRGPGREPYDSAPAREPRSRAIEPYRGTASRPSDGGAPADGPYGVAPSSSLPGAPRSAMPDPAPRSGIPDDPPYRRAPGDRPRGSASADQPYGRPYGGGVPAADRPYSAPPGDGPYGGSARVAVPGEDTYGRASRNGQPGSAPRSGVPGQAYPAAPTSGRPGVAPRSGAAGPGDGSEDSYRASRRRAESAPSTGRRNVAGEPPFDEPPDPDDWRRDLTGRRGGPGEDRDLTGRRGGPGEDRDDPRRGRRGRSSGAAPTESWQRDEPAAWQLAEREESAHGSAPYRDGGAADWRRDLAGQGDAAEGELRRYGTSDYVPFRSGGSAAVPGGSNLSMTSTSLLVPAREPDVRPQRGGNGFQSSTGAYERRPVSGGLMASRRSDLLDPDDEEDDQEPAGPLVAVGYTLGWYGVPVVLLVFYMLLFNSGSQSHALDTLTKAAPQFGVSLVLSVLVALGLRWASSSWKAVSVGLAAAVVGGGLATVLSSAITGNSLS